MALKSIPHMKGHITRTNREIARHLAVIAARKKVGDAHEALERAFKQLKTAQVELDVAIRKQK